GNNGNGPGLDATIFTGGPDLKFMNDTGNWLLMQSTSNPRTGVAEVSFYGTKLNRTVTLTQSINKRIPAPHAPKIVADPKQPFGTSRQSDTARGGMTIAVYRTIIENGVRKQPELFRTTFRAWPNIYVFNPANIGPDGRPLIPFGARPAPQPTPAPEQIVPTPEQIVPAQEQPATSDG
ncbi:MAG: vanomycin resistance protein VanB, partial [Roseiflexaceae bacterium]